MQERRNSSATFVSVTKFCDIIWPHMHKQLFLLYMLLGVRFVGGSFRSIVYGKHTYRESTQVLRNISVATVAWPLSYVRLYEHIPGLNIRWVTFQTSILSLVMLNLLTHRPLADLDAIMNRQYSILLYCRISSDLFMIMP